MQLNINYKVSKAQREKQSMLYATSYIHNIINDTNNKIFAVSSTLNNFDMREFIIRQISKNMIENYDYKVLNCFVNLNDDSNIEYISKDSVDSVINVNSRNLREVLEEKKDKYDAIFVIMESVNVFADALNCAKLCDSAIMIERYLYSKYNEYEKSIMRFKENNISVSGVITYK